LPRVSWLLNLLARRNTINRYMRAFNATGFKLTYSHTRRHPGIVDWCRENQVKVIHLICENLLRKLLG
jgi:hypothetical protein